MAVMELRPYQKEAREAVFEQWETVKRTLLVLPTGCGKTVVFAKVAEECVRKRADRRGVSLSVCDAFSRNDMRHACLLRKRIYSCARRVGFPVI